MKTVYKYNVSLEGDSQVLMPDGAEIIGAGMQSTPVMWAVVDTDAPEAFRKFRVYGTGHELSSSEILNHVATIQDPPFVWHIFEVN